MKKLKIYLDTSVVSHLDQQDALVLMTDTLKLWKTIQDNKYDVVISNVLIYEVERCYEPKKSKLLKYLKDINYQIITLNEEIEDLSRKFISNKILTIKSIDDCRHIASSIISGCDIIVSWNFKHIVNYKTIKGVKVVSLMEGYKDITICTPTMLSDLEV
jgi:hypothetical protein